jgi:hypothetical protein
MFSADAILRDLDFFAVFLPFLMAEKFQIYLGKRDECSVLWSILFYSRNAKTKDLRGAGFFILSRSCRRRKGHHCVHYGKIFAIPLQTSCGMGIDVSNIMQSKAVVFSFCWSWEDVSLNGTGQRSSRLCKVPAPRSDIIVPKSSP